MTRTVAPVSEPVHFVGPFSSLVRSFLQCILLWPIVCWFCYPFSRRGHDRIPRRPVIFVANHASHADTAAILRALPRAVRRRTVVAAAEDHFWRSPSLGGFVSLLTGAFPFPRSGCEGLHRTERMLAHGYNVLLYPEGTRSNGGSVGEFQKGAAILASRGATIVPVGLQGTGDVLPKARKRPRRGPVAVVFGDPVPSAEASGCEHLRRHVQVAATAARRDAAALAPTFFERARSFAHSPSAPRLLFLWAVAEALVWPIVPDFALFPLLLVAPTRAAAMVSVTAAGSVVGGLAAYVVGASAAGPSLLAAAPLVSDQMVAAAAQMLRDDGALGLLGQPLSGIPYKVFALQAAGADVAVPGYIVMSVVARAGRFLVVALLAVLLSSILRPLWERGLHLFLVLYSVSFVAGLVRVFASWNQS